jgi:Tfp pilus assembly protein PilN
MKPVNLLPQNARPYTDSGGTAIRSYLVIGVLVLLVAALAGYVLTTNQITTKKNEIKSANAEESQAQAQVSSLASYATFNNIAATRISTVTSLALGRIDYERLMRETALVLPDGVWLSSLDAEAGTGVSAATTTPTAATGSATGTGAPTVDLQGCAKTQDAVATTLVRLRAIHGSDEVDLQNSAKDLAAGTANATATSGCGGNYTWDITVNLQPTTVTGVGDAGQKVPVRLGGGS